MLRMVRGDNNHVEIEGYAYGSTPMQPYEESNFELVFNNLPFYSVAAEIIKDAKTHIKGAAMIAKLLLNSHIESHSNSGGIYMMPIQPWHLLRSQSEAETPVEFWGDYQKGAEGGDLVYEVTRVAQGELNWVGYGMNNGKNINIDKKMLICIVGYENISEQPDECVLTWHINAQYFSSEHIGKGISAGITRILGPRDMVNAKLKHQNIEAGDPIIRPIGVTIGTGYDLHSVHRPCR